MNIVLYYLCMGPIYVLRLQKCILLLKTKQSKTKPNPNPHKTKKKNPVALTHKCVGNRSSRAFLPIKGPRARLAGGAPLGSVVHEQGKGWLAVRKALLLFLPL